jgi:hypothetical protein
MMMPETRNPQYTAQGSIDCEIRHPTLGWIPFTAAPDDPEEQGRQVFTALKDQAAPYLPPPPPTAVQIAAGQRAFAEAARAQAYAAEADPLFFKAQRGEIPMQDWTQKVAEIRARYPYPED